MFYTFATEAPHKRVSARLTNQHKEKMKEYQLHKISGVDKNICTAEQKLAYEYAWTYRNLNMTATELALLVMKWRAGDTKYNWCAVSHLIDMHFDSYRGSKCHILSSYDEIGRAFPVKID